MKLNEYLDLLLWSQSDLSRNAKVSSQAVARALTGEKITRHTASKIVAALSRGVKRELTINDVEGLQLVALRKRKKLAQPETQVVKPVKSERKQPEKQG